ncbi:hypothetical protein BsWGS_01157 [Bradybaena similaris]
MTLWNNLQILMLVFGAQVNGVVTTLEPKFDMPMVNVTAQEKTTAELPCSVSSLGTYQVVWTDQFSTLLTYEDRRIIDDERLSIERPFTRDWNLHIRDVRYSDQGIYNCQINTNPVKVKTVNLIVLVPAKIIDHLSTSDVTVREGETVTMVCNVTGTPQPTVSWYRLVTESKGIQRHKVGVNGEVLIIHNVTRHCGDRYECVAFNGVPPAVTRVIEVFVEFAPEIYLPNKRIGQEKGKETILECTVTAFPHAVTMWKKGDHKIQTSTLKYRVEVYDEDKDKLTLSLRVFNIQDSDFGVYTCEASNTLGEDEESMYLYDYAEHTRTTTTTPATTMQMYMQGTSTHWDSELRPEVRLRPSATSDHQRGHAWPGEDTQRPRYTSRFGPGDPSDTRIMASEDEADCAERSQVSTVAVVMATWVTLYTVNTWLS